MNRVEKIEKSEDDVRSERIVGEQTLSYIMK
jgi:hypothetical protein